VNETLSQNLDLSDLTEREGLGLINESFLYSLLSSISKEFNLRVEWKGKQSYDKSQRNEKRRGADFKIYNEKGNLWLLGEAKNPLTPKKRYSRYVAERDVNSRFMNESQAKHNVLFISNFDVYQPDGQQAILNNNSVIFETGKVIGKRDFKTKIYHIIKSRLREFIKNLLHKDREQTQHQTRQLTEYINQQQQLTIQTITKNNPNFFNQLNSFNTDNTIIIKTVDRPSYNVELVSRVFSLANRKEPVEQPQSYRWKVYLAFKASSVQII
jgi:hypothetical protein